MIDSAEFNITKTCPFLNKPCIKDDCPSFKVIFYSFSEFTDHVILLKETKKLFGTKIEKEGWGLFVGWNERYTPVCQVLDTPGHSRWHREAGVPVGDLVQKVRTEEPKWIKSGWWSSSHREVTEIPKIQSSTQTANEEVE